MIEELYKYIIYLNEKKLELMKEILNSDLMYSNNIQVKKIIENIFNFNIDIKLNDIENIIIEEYITYVNNKSNEFRNYITIIKNDEQILLEEEIINILRKKKMNNII